MSKKNAWLAFLAVVVLAAGICAGYFISKKGANIFADRTPYAAVYLSTGDIYYGKFHSWPKPYLENVWYVQNDAEGKPQLIPYKDLFWGPGEKLYLNPDQIIWWSYLRSDSGLLEAFQKVTQQNQSK